MGLPKRYLNAQYKTTILPIVLPIVLYNGPKRYKGPRTLLEAYPKPTLLLHPLRGLLIRGSRFPLITGFRPAPVWLSPEVRRF